MSDLFAEIDARTRLAGTNKLEILLFHLGKNRKTGRNETFGINVFKIREVMRTPEITTAPEMPETVIGMVCLRGILVPVIDLSKYSSIDTESSREVMIVTEYNGKTQGLLVTSVETILRLDWSQMRVPPEMLTRRTGGMVTAVSEIDGQLVMLLDVEKVLVETTEGDGVNGNESDMLYKDIQPLGRQDLCVYFADDSSAARKQIEKTLQVLGLRYVSTFNGLHAWGEIDRTASFAMATGRPANQFISLVLTDVEMPEMDGYSLTKKIKSDPRLKGIPVVMHSSLSGMSNQQLGRSVGVDDYIAKFDPVRLADTLTKILGQAEPRKN